MVLAVERLDIMTRAT